MNVKFIPGNFIAVLILLRISGFYKLIFITNIFINYGLKYLKNLLL
ncbi:MAG: hypothetical protein RIR31_972 [Bacteroidota bacterium]|jgi:hypothetical protein